MHGQGRAACYSNKFGLEDILEQHTWYNISYLMVPTNIYTACINACSVCHFLSDRYLMTEIERIKAMLLSVNEVVCGQGYILKKFSSQCWHHGNILCQV